MKTSAQGVDFICQAEGWVDHVYKDRAGLDTIGFGHRVLPGEHFNTITRNQGEWLMSTDLGRFETAVNADVLVEITQCEFDALVSFAYNAGAGALAHSTALALLNAGNRTGCAAALLAWDKRLDPKTNALAVDAGLLSRRQAEAKLFLSDGAAAANDNPYDAPDDQNGIAA